VWTAQVPGPRASRDPDRYRLLVDYRGVRAVVERVAPDVLETHDPWFSLPMGLMLRFRGPYRGLLTTYCHADPMQTYLQPWLAKWTRLPGAAAHLSRWADRQLHRQHTACHAVFAASDVMVRRLAEAGVTRVTRIGLGVDQGLLRLVARRRSPEARLLYAGRLDDDKEFPLLLGILPRLLADTGVHVTIAGAGKYTKDVATIAHPRLRYLGHLSDRLAMRALYGCHDVLLAPGRHETFGLSALEGAAAGLVVVGPSAGGTGELLRQCDSDLAFEPGSAEAFFGRVRAAIDGDRTDLVRRGRQVAAGFGSWSDAIARHVAVYESLVGEAVTQAARSSGSPVRNTLPART
jgi:glycosyltransferase involved in cell wall biosynthesis